MDKLEKPNSGKTQALSPYAPPSLEWLAGLMASIKVRYPSQELTPETAEAFLEDWAYMITQHGIDRFRVALRAATFACKFFPGPAEINEHMPPVAIQEENATLTEMKRLEKQRKDNPEQFFGLGDLARDVMKKFEDASAAKQMASAGKKEA